MILVDSSVWIAFLTCPDSETSPRLRSLIEDNNKVCVCGIVLQEVLQGIRSDRQYRLVKEKLSRFPFVLTNRETYELASSIYRSLRKKGVTVPTVDASLSAIAIQNGLDFFTLDREHFTKIAKHTQLKLY